MTYLFYVYSAPSGWPLTNASFGPYAFNNLYYSQGSSWAGYYIVGAGPNTVVTTSAPNFYSNTLNTDSVDPNTYHFTAGLQPVPVPPPPPSPPHGWL
jgi:hypothetical protein